MDSVNLCACCATFTVHLFKCSLCKQTGYCSKKCQEIDCKKCHKLLCIRGQSIPNSDLKETSKKVESVNYEECANCGSKSKGRVLSKCSRCKKTSYCSKPCQAQHWSAVGGHKKFCLLSIKRSPDEFLIVPSEDGAKCVICQENLFDSFEKDLVLPCTHVFHAECIWNLCGSGGNFACPLCRAPFTSRKEDHVIDMESIQYRYFKISEAVDNGDCSWDSLTPIHRTEINEVISILHRICEYDEDGKASFLLSEIFNFGHGVSQNFFKGFHWAKKAADQGNTFAEYKLGVMFTNGYGVEQNYEFAVKYFRRSANKGFIKSQHMLGMMYHNGHGVENNYPVAMSWFCKAAELGLDCSQFMLGVMYGFGRGVEIDPIKSIYWLCKSADQGFVSAQEGLKNLP